jgi:hypothetical protein
MIYMPIVNGVWVKYTMPCLQNANLTNATNSSMNGVGCIIGTVSQNIPFFWTGMVIVWYVALLFFMANDPQRSRIIAIAMGGLVFCTVLAGYGVIGTTIWATSFALFLLTLFIYLAGGER